MRGKNSSDMLRNILENQLFLYLILIILGIPAIFFSTSQSMINTYINDGSFSHGFLIFPIAIWLIFEQRNQIEKVLLSPEPRVFVLFLGMAFLWLIADIVDVQVIKQLAMVLLIPITIWILLGRKLFLHLIFPLTFLLFAVPMGNSLISPMMDFTANLTVEMVKLTGIPIYREGLLFTLPTGNWSVIEACSGVRYLIATFTLGTLYAYLTYQSNVKRIIFITLAIIIAAIANGIRAFGIVMIGHFSNMKYGVGGDHTFYGWIFYGLVIFLLFFVGYKWSDRIQEPKNSIADLKNILKYKALNIPALILIIASLTSIQFISKTLTSSSSLQNDKYVISTPENFEAWQQTIDRDIGWEPIITNPDIKIQKTYIFGDNITQLTIGYFKNQTHDAEAVSYGNRLADDKSRWKKVSSTDLNIGDKYVTETELSMGNGTHKTLVWNWYIIGEFSTPSPVIAKILNAINLIIYRRNDAAYITIATPSIENDLNHGREQLKSFMTGAQDYLSNGFLNNSKINSTD